jgi:hypothetical protein
LIPKPRRIKDSQLLTEVRGSPCCICGRPADPAHIKSRGSGGNDVPENIVPLCRVHHTLQHALGWKRFTEKYPVRTWAELKK